MKKFSIVLAGIGVLLSSAAFATDEIQVPSNGPLLHQARVVCNEYGRCWNSRRRVIIRDGESYGYVPRERYIERRGYRDYDDGPSVGIRTPGGTFGIGVDHDRW